MMAQDAAHLLPGALAPGLLALADEVVVLDGGSRDETAAVARRLGAKVVPAPFPVAGFGEQQTRAVHECSSDWVLVLDADEVASSALLAQLPDLIRSRRRSGWWLPRRWAVPLGSGVAWIDQPPHWPDYQPRLARRIPSLRHVGAIHQTLSSGSPGSWGLAHDAPLVHLDLVVNDHRARSQKVAQRTGTPGFRGTEAFYLWEDTPTALAALDADEHETLAALARVLGSRGVA
jgi:glycosyltransferase involved in cell wall biosynthesis